MNIKVGVAFTSGYLPYPPQRLCPCGPFYIEIGEQVYGEEVGGYIYRTVG